MSPLVPSLLLCPFLNGVVCPLFVYLSMFSLIFLFTYLYPVDPILLFKNQHSPSRFIQVQPEGVKSNPEIGKQISSWVPWFWSHPRKTSCECALCLLNLPHRSQHYLPLSEANSGIYLWGPESLLLQGFSDKWSALAQSLGYCKPAEVFWRWFWLVIGGKRFVSPESSRNLTRFTPFKEDSSNIWRNCGPWSPGLWAMSMPEALSELH